MLVENFRRDTLDKLGLGYEVLAKANPALIYCAVTGFGRDGPLADKGGFDLVAQGFAGLMAITGEPGRPPVKTGNPVSDINAGLLAAIGVLAAYAQRLQTGRGQLVDTSLFEAALQQTYWHAASYLRDRRNRRDRSARRTSSPRPTRRSTRATATSTSAAPTRRTGSASPTCSATPSGATTRASRPTPRAWSTAMRWSSAMNDVLGTRTRAEWIAALDAAGVPAGPVHSLGEALTHPQTLARGMVVELVHPQAGPTRAIGCPDPLLGARRPPSTLPAPLLGEHTRDAAARMRLHRRGDRRASRGRRRRRAGVTHDIAW